MGLFDPWDTTLPEGGGLSESQRLGGVFGLLGAGLSNMSWGRSNANLFTQFDRTRLLQEQQNVKRRQQQKYQDMIENLQKSGGSMEVIDKLKDEQAQMQNRIDKHREGAMVPEHKTVTKQVARPPMLTPQEAAVYQAMDPNQGSAALANRMQRDRDARIAANKLTSAVVGDRLVSKMGDNVIDIRAIPKTEHERALAAAELQKIQLETQRMRSQENARRAMLGGGQPQPRSQTQPQASTGGVIPDSPEAAVRAAQAAAMPAPAAATDTESGIGWAPESSISDAMAVMDQNAVPMAERKMILDAAERYGVDPRVATGLFKTESDFGRNKKVGRAGAIGYGQIVPKYHSSDPETNINASMAILADRIKARDGNVGLALQDYHTGQGNVDAAMAGNAPAAFGEASKAYVPTVLANAGVTPVSQTAAVPTSQQTEELANMSEVDIARKAVNAPLNDIERLRIAGAEDPTAELSKIQKDRRDRYDEERRIAIQRRAEERQFSTEQRARMNELRDDYTRDAGDSKEVMESVKQGLSANTNTGSGQATLLFSFVKALDPGSVVRGSEIEISAPALFSNQQKMLINAFNEGGIENTKLLFDKEVGNMRNELKRIGSQRHEKLMQIRSDYTARAKLYGVMGENEKFPIAVMNTYSGFDPEAPQYNVDWTGGKNAGAVKGDAEAGADVAKKYDLSDDAEKAESNAARRRRKRKKPVTTSGLGLEKRTSTKNQRN